jgi:hypothetical protein
MSSTPALLAAYADTLLRPPKAAIEAVLIMEPLRRFTISRATA